MRRATQLRFLTGAACALAVVIPVGCGGEEPTHVVEGEPLELGGLAYKVALTRFLNANDVEDSEYLEGLPVTPPKGKAYLGVFMEIDNETDQPKRVPQADDMEVVDTSGQTAEPTELESIFSLPFGATIPPDDRVPDVESAAANGPAQGSLILFVIDRSVNENRPLELDITNGGKKGSIELDL